MIRRPSGAGVKLIVDWLIGDVRRGVVVRAGSLASVRANGGFSLLEMLVALVILSLSLGSLYQSTTARDQKCVGSGSVHPGNNAGRIYARVCEPAYRGGIGFRHVRVHVGKRRPGPLKTYSSALRVRGRPSGCHTAVCSGDCGLAGRAI